MEKNHTFLFAITIRYLYMFVHVLEYICQRNSRNILDYSVLNTFLQCALGAEAAEGFIYGLLRSVLRKGQTMLFLACFIAFFPKDLKSLCVIMSFLCKVGSCSNICILLLWTLLENPTLQQQLGSNSWPLHCNWSSTAMLHFIKNEIFPNLPVGLQGFWISVAH